MVPLMDDFKEKIQDFFSSIPNCPDEWKGSLKSENNSDAKLFEIFFFTKVAEQIRDGKEWELKIGNEKQIKEFVFRGSPGYLWSKDEYGYFELESTSKDKRFELHLGVQISGSSTVLHEIDISIIDSVKARVARDKGEKFNVTGLDTPLIIECKNYTKTKLSKYIGREWMGVCLDTKRTVNNDKTSRLGIFVSSSDSEDVKTLLEFYFIKYIGKAREIQQIEKFNNIIKKFLSDLGN